MRLSPISPSPGNPQGYSNISSPLELLRPEELPLFFQHVPVIQNKKRLELAQLISDRGIMDPVGCSRCQRLGLKCLRHERSSKCGNCVRSGLRCGDPGPSPRDMAKISAERNRLRAQKTVAREAVRFAQQRVLEAMAKVETTERLEEYLEKRAGEMIRRGVESIEELEILEKQEERDRVATSSVAGVSDKGKSVEVASGGSPWNPETWSDFPSLSTQELLDVFGTEDSGVA